MRPYTALLALVVFLLACSTTDSSDPVGGDGTDAAETDRGRRAEDFGNRDDSGTADLVSDSNAQDVATDTAAPEDVPPDAHELPEDVAGEPDTAPSCPLELVGYNTGGTLGTGVAGGDVIYAIRFTLAESATIERVEIMTGDLDEPGGELTLSVYGSVGGLPSSTAVASGTVPIQETSGWHGVDLTTPSPLQAGDWWLVFISTVDLLTPQSLSGTAYTHVWGFDHGDWTDIGLGPFMEANWMIKVVGCPSE